MYKEKLILNETNGTPSNVQMRYTGTNDDEAYALDQNHKYFILVDGEDKGEKLEDWVTYKFRKEFGIFINNEVRVNDEEKNRVGR